MENGSAGGYDSEAYTTGKPRTKASSGKAQRTMLVAILLQVTAPARLSKQAIWQHLPFYGENPQKAIDRDIETLTGNLLEQLPEPDAENLTEWCEEQQRQHRLAITYERRTRTFGLVQSVFSLDISEEEARAFVALQEGFAPGTPYAEAVQHLLGRWAWMFSEKSRLLIQQKRKRRGRPVVLPLSPVVDYSQHSTTILLLDQALEEGAYISFAYTPLTRSWDDEPTLYEHAEPYELEYREGHWYFTAYIFEMSTYLDFRVDRMHPASLQKNNDRFTPGMRRGPGVKIRYWVSPMLARHGSLSTRLREQQVILLDGDQGAIVEGYARSIWWARRLLLGYGEQVKAMEPDELVRGMREAASAMERLYEED